MDVTGLLVTHPTEALDGLMARLVHEGEVLCPRQGGNETGDDTDQLIPHPQLFILLRVESRPLVE